MIKFQAPNIKQIPNNKHQISNNDQIPKTKLQTRTKFQRTNYKQGPNLKYQISNHKIFTAFGIWNFGHWNLFGI
jgi:hypothetical protein